MKPNLTFGFYGDDFTGSTDALEFVCRSGLKTVLFIEPPTPEMLAEFPDLQAIGVAGSTRAMAPEKMEATLRRDFALMKEAGIELVHYKTCSTFDSSPTVGSIGKAIDVGFEVFGNRAILVVAGAPHLSRYCVFGNLFARMGIGSDAEIYRLDRHPVMRHHPVTPATESDLCVVLSQQCDRSMDLLNLIELTGKNPISTLEAKIEVGAEVVVIDGLSEGDMKKVGALISEFECGKQRLIVGSSGVEFALGLHLKESGDIYPEGMWSPCCEVDSLLVVSGSCSAVTESQILYGLENGFVDVAVQTDHLFSCEVDRLHEIERCQKELKMFLNGGRDVIVHSAIGKSDVRLLKTREVALRNNISAGDFEKVSGEIIGDALGRIAAVGLENERSVVRLRDRRWRFLQLRRKSAGNRSR